MRTILFCTLVCAGCFDYERLSSGLTADGGLADADQSSEQDGGVETDGAVALDLAGADLAGVDLTAKDMTPLPPDMTCATYTHGNGLGQTWTDCVPLWTHTDTQAMKACLASFPVGSCTYPPSGSSCYNKAIAGYDGDWTYFVYAGTLTGKTILPDSDCTVSGVPSSWN